MTEDSNDDDMEEYEVVVTLPLPITIRTVEKRAPSFDVLDKIKEMMTDRGILSIAKLRAMPTNPDMPFMSMLKASLRDLKILVINMHDKIMEDGKLALYLKDLLSMRNAIIHMNQLTNDIEEGKDMSAAHEEGLNKAVAEGRASILTANNMEDVDVEILHAMAHKVAEAKDIEFSCLEHGIDKAKIIEWLRRYAFGIEGAAN